MKRGFVLALLLEACGFPPLIASTAERSAGAAALSAWRSSGLQNPMREGCNASDFSIRIADDASYWHLCGADPNTQAGCLNWTSDSRMFNPGLRPLIVVAPWTNASNDLVVHELLHAMLVCSDVDLSGDPQHADPRVWQAAGGATSVQARAHAILAGGK